jgi:hypothetical protein
MAFLNQYGLDYLISKMANKFANVSANLSAISDKIADVGGSAYPLVYHGMDETSCTIESNILHVWGVMQELVIHLSGKINANVANEYIFQFASGEVPTVLTITHSIKWNSSEPPIFEANKIYQISILNDLATVMSWDL